MCLAPQTRLRDHDDASEVHTIIQPFGANITSKSKGSFRVAVQNPNGLRLGNVKEGLECIDVMSENKIDLFGLSETRLNASMEARSRLATMIRLDG